MPVATSTNCTSTWLDLRVGENAGKGGTSGNFVEEGIKKAQNLNMETRERILINLLLEVRLPTSLEGPESVMLSSYPPQPLVSGGGGVIINSFTGVQAAN